MRSPKGSGRTWMMVRVVATPMSAWRRTSSSFSRRVSSATLRSLKAEDMPPSSRSRDLDSPSLSRFRFSASIYRKDIIIMRKEEEEKEEE